MTPRQIAGYLILASVRHRYEAAELLSLHASAAQGDNKGIKELLGKLTKDI